MLYNANKGKHNPKSTRVPDLHTTLHYLMNEMKNNRGTETIFVRSLRIIKKKLMRFRNWE